jgi:hypothetical protein
MNDERDVKQRSDEDGANTQSPRALSTRVCRSWFDELTTNGFLLSVRPELVEGHFRLQ